MFATEITALVLDAGSCYLKAGFAGEDSPRVVIPSAVPVGRASDMEVETASQRRPLFGGLGLSACRPDVEIHPVVEGAAILSFEDYDSLVCESWRQLDVKPSDYCHLVAEPMSAFREQREKVAEILFKKHNAKNIYFCKAPVLSTFASGRSTSVVVDCGASGVAVTAVHDGYALLKSAKKHAVGGEAVTRSIYDHLVATFGKVPHLARLRNPDMSFSESLDRFHGMSLAREAKEHYCSEEEDKAGFVLPDNNPIYLNKEHFAEPFFAPNAGVPQLVLEAVGQSDSDVKREMMANTVVVGGSSSLSGFVPRLGAKLQEISPGSLKPKVISLPFAAERKYSQWIGGSILGCLSSFQCMWVGEHEYEEQGPVVLEKKCS